MEEIRSSDTVSRATTPPSDPAAIIDAAPVAIYAKDADGVYTVMNEWGANRAGGTVGQTDHDIFPSAAADQIVETDRRVRESGEVIVRHEVPVGADGVPFDVISMKFPIPDGGVGGITIPVDGDVRGITKLIGAATDGDPLQAVLARLPIGLITLGRDGRVQAMNQPARDLGNEIGQVPPAARTDRAEFAAALVADVLREAKPTFLRNRLADGSPSLTIAFPVDADTVAFIGFTGHDEMGRQLDLVREDEIERLRELVRELGGDPDQG